MTTKTVTISPQGANDAGEPGLVGAPLNRPMPSLGDQIAVTVPKGMRLRNTETGGFFEPGVASPQTVTVTTLQRLRDGDLVRV